MPPQPNIFSVQRILPIRPPIHSPTWRVEYISATYRGFAHSRNLPISKCSDSINTDKLPFVRRDIPKVWTIGGRDLGVEQSSTVEEIINEDNRAIKMPPNTINNRIQSFSLKGSRLYSTSTASYEQILIRTSELPSAETPGVKFGLPALPIPSELRMKHRYDPVVQQVTNLIMKHGQKGIAQRNMALILNRLRTSPPPQINPDRPLLPGAPPPSHLPLNPILYLTLAIDSVAPLLRIRSQRGAAGGGVALQIPVPLGMRQRRRTAVQWILAAANKRRNRGSGKGGFSQRVAEELIAVVEGKSSVWERRNALHKLGVAARANLTFRSVKMR